MNEKNPHKKNIEQQQGNQLTSDNDKSWHYKPLKRDLKIRPSKKKKKVKKKKTKSSSISTLQVELMGNTFKTYPEIPITDFPLYYNVVRCVKCRSRNTIKKGFIKHKIRSPTQRYQCKNCSTEEHPYKFIIDAGRHFHIPLSIVDLIIDQIIIGTPSRYISRYVKKVTSKFYGKTISPSKQSVIDIAIKVHKILSNFEFFLYHQNPSAIWMIDDIYQKMSMKKYPCVELGQPGTKKKKRVKSIHVYAHPTNVMAINTRYFLACPISLNRNTAISIKALYLSKKRAKYSPKEIKADGWQAHVNAAESIFPNTKITSVAKDIRKDIINHIERLNATFRTYGLKRMTTFRRIEFLEAIAELSRIHYNFFKPHSALHGKTPAQAAGITIPFKDWEDLIRYADYLELYHEL